MEGGFVVEGISCQKGRHVFFPAVDPMHIRVLTPRFTENERRMTPYKTKGKSGTGYSVLIRF